MLHYELLYTTAIAQAVSAGFPTRRPVFQPGSSHVAVFFFWQNIDGAGFLRVLRFPLPIFIPQIAPQSPSSHILGWYNKPVLADVPSGLSLTPLRIITIKIIYGKKYKVFPVLNELSSMPWRCMGEWMLEPPFLYLGNSWKWVDVRATFSLPRQ
jgi:hypothetical protein